MRRCAPLAGEARKGLADYAMSRAVAAPSLRRRRASELTLNSSPIHRHMLS
jgi:hypothetical protein